MPAAAARVRALKGNSPSKYRAGHLGTDSQDSATSAPTLSTTLLAMPQRRSESRLTSDSHDRQHLVWHQICGGKSCDFSHASTRKMKLIFDVRSRLLTVETPILSEPEMSGRNTNDPATMGVNRSSSTDSA